MVATLNLDYRNFCKILMASRKKRNCRNLKDNSRFNLKWCYDAKKRKRALEATSQRIGIRFSFIET